MKGRAPEKLIYEHLYPKPKSNDPQSFQAFQLRYLMPEVKQESHAFYGDLNTQEAKFPGLDYTHPTHRIRLCRYPNHRRFFHAMDAVRLTPGEISKITQWEGTLWAKKKYEEESGTIVRDTTADDIPTWDEVQAQQQIWSGTGDARVSGGASRRRARDDEEDDREEEEDDGDEESEGDFQSVAVELNQRLRAGAARRAAGDTSAVLDEEWEQWLKNAVESGILTTALQEQTYRRYLDPRNELPINAIPLNILEAARSGEWSRVPDIVQPLVRRVLDREAARQVQEAVENAPRDSSYSEDEEDEDDDEDEQEAPPQQQRLPPPTFPRNSYARPYRPTMSQLSFNASDPTQVRNYNLLTSPVGVPELGLPGPLITLEPEGLHHNHEHDDHSPESRVAAAAEAVSATWTVMPGRRTYSDLRLPATSQTQTQRRS